MVGYKKYSKKTPDAKDCVFTHILSDKIEIASLTLLRALTFFVFNE